MYIRIHIYIYYIIIYLYSPKLRTKYSKTNRQITNMLPTVNPPQFPTKVQYEHPLLGFSEIGYPKKTLFIPAASASSIRMALGPLPERAFISPSGGSSKKFTHSTVLLQRPPCFKDVPWSFWKCHFDSSSVILKMSTILRYFKICSTIWWIHA